MRTFSKYQTTFALFLVIAAGFLWLRARNNVGESKEYSRTSNSGVVIKNNGIEESQSSNPKNSGNRTKIKTLPIWNWNDFEPLEWSVDQLDEFFNSKSTELTSREMASLMNHIFPAPFGAPDQANRIKAGSIPLKEQFRLCLKYVSPEDQSLVFSGFWVTYRNTNFLEEYYREVVQQIPPGDDRTRAITEYYFHSLKSYSDIKRFLASDELKDLQARESKTQIEPNCSDCLGIIYALGGALRETLERGEVSVEEIVEDLKNSNMDTEYKARLTRGIEKQKEQLKSLQDSLK